MDIKHYNEFIEQLNQSKDDEIESAFWAEFEQSQQTLDEFLSNINESAFKRILGGLTGLAFGKLMSRIIIKSLGIDPKGTLGKILSSRTVHVAIGAAFGKK